MMPPLAGAGSKQVNECFQQTHNHRCISRGAFFKLIGRLVVGR